MLTRRHAVIAALAVSVAALVIVAVITRPWLAFIDVAVDDEIPPVSPPAAATAEPSPPTLPQPAAEPIALASGDFISHEHETTGTATVIENPDGTRLLAIENLSTTNGPDVHVWLSASEVVPGVDGWFVAGSAPFIDLGPIKGNLGDQLYEIPEGVDLADYRSVSLWCVQFGVSFGAASLT